MFRALRRQPGKRRSLFFIVTGIVLSISLILSYNLSIFAINPFVKHTGEVDLQGLTGVTDSWVIKDGATYKMWFTHPRTEVEPSQIAGLVGDLDLNAIFDALEQKDIDALLNHISGLDAQVIYDLLKDTAPVIGYAESANGIDWDNINPEVLSASPALQGVAGPCVIKVAENDYRMWYSRNTTDYNVQDIEDILAKLQGTNQERIDAILAIIDNNQAVIEYATSTDGKNWGTPDLTDLEGAGEYLGDSVGAPSVIFDGTNYHMWFSNLSTGIEQSDIEYIIENIADITPEYLFGLQAKATGSIGYATSSDGTTWTGVNRSVFSGGSGALNAVAAPCVIYDGSEYHMWYTYGVTELTQDDISSIIAELSTIDINPLIDYFEAENYDALLIRLDEIIGTDIYDSEIPETRTRLNGTTTRIGYATSPDNSVWSIQDPYALTGASDTPWSSVGRPSVVKTGDIYQIWFTKGIDELSAQNLVDLWQGTISTIGYASSSALMAETSSRMAVDGDGVVVIELVIDRIKDITSGDTVTDYGGITGFHVCIDVDLPDGVELVDVREVGSFQLAFVDKTGFEFWTGDNLTPVMPDGTVVAKVVLRLTGDALTTYNVTFSFKSITVAEPAGLNIPAEDMDAMQFLRGDTTNDGVVGVGDSLFILQYLAGIRAIDEINPINAASVAHDGITGDRIGVGDSLFILQYLAGIRDVNYE